jgi:hypothetical protein
LTNPDYAKFTLVSKFGESFGGTGGLSTTTLQQAYDNSTTPEIIINSILDGLSIKNGTGNADNITRLLEGINTVGDVTSYIRADGFISGTTLQTNNLSANTISATTYLNLPIDVRVTGGTYSSGTAIFKNNTGGTFSVTGFSTGGSGGGDSITGGTYNNSTDTLTLSTTGSSIYVTGFTTGSTSSTFTGGTVSGATQFIGGLTANTISATTIYGDGSNLTGVAHAFTGTTTLDFSSLISGETSFATTYISNSNINSVSTVMIRFVPSTNHPNASEATIEELVVDQTDIVDGVGFNINAYANAGTWGVYNIVYRIIN